MHRVDCFRYALFKVGRYEDVIRTQRRRLRPTMLTFSMLKSLPKKAWRSIK